MIHPKSLYGDVKGIHCGCGKYRSREYILKKLRGGMGVGVRQHLGTDHRYAQCTKCGVTLAEYEIPKKHGFDYRRIEAMDLQELIHYSLGKR